MHSSTASPDVGLMLVYKVAGLDHLHFGCWERGDALTFDNCAAAQHRYTQRLIDWVPAGARTVLDVGCGIGATSQALHERGYDVHSVTPDPSQAKEFRCRVSPEVQLHECRFQELSPSTQSSVILFSESAQYFPLNDWVNGCKRHLDRDGARTVIVADWFLRPDRTYWGTPHDEAEFRARLGDEGFVLRREADITEETAPTLTYLTKLHGAHLIPTFDYIDTVLTLRAPFWYRVTQLIAGRWINRAVRFMSEDVGERLDPDHFKERVRYRVFQFEVARDAITE